MLNPLRRFSRILYRNASNGDDAGRESLITSGPGRGDVSTSLHIVVEREPSNSSAINKSGLARSRHADYLPIELNDTTETPQDHPIEENQQLAPTSWAVPFWKYFKEESDIDDFQYVIQRCDEAENMESKLDSNDISQADRQSTLEDLITIYTDLVERTSQLYHPLHLSCLNGMGNTWLERHYLTDDYGDLEKAIKNFLLAISDAKNPYHEVEINEQQLFISLTQAVVALRLRHTIHPSSDDLDTVIDFDRKIIPLGPIFPFVHLCNLGCDLVARYDKFRDEKDSVEAVKALRNALGLLSPANSDIHRLKILRHLAAALGKEYTRTMDISILEECIARHKDALVICDVGHSERAPVLRHLSAALGCLYEHTLRVGLLHDAILHLRQAVNICDHQEQKEYVFPLSTTIFNLYTATADLKDLEEVVSLRKECLDLCAIFDEKTIPFIIGYAEALHALYRHNDEVNVLEMIIERLRSAQGIDEEHTMTKFYLAVALCDRYDRYQRIKDLSESIDLHRAVAGRLHKDDPRWNNLMISLARTLDKGFVQWNNRNYLEESISISREVAGSFENEPWNQYADLAGLLLKHYTHFNESTSLDEAIAFFELALACPKDHSERPSILNNFATALALHTYSPNSAQDLDFGIDLLKESEGLCQLGHPSYSRSLHNLGRLYMLKYKQSQQRQHFDEAMRAFSQAVHDPHRSALSRYLFAKGWIDAIADQPPLDADMGEIMSDAFEQAILLLPQLASFGLDINKRIEHLNDSAGLACSAADHALRNSNPEKALELLEQGRSVFWSQALRLRTKFDDLPPDTSRRLIEISSELETKGLNHDSFAYGKRGLTLEEEANRRKQLASDFDLLVSGARAIPKLRNFLRPEPFQQLTSTAKCGPVVVLIPGKPHCHALVLAYPPTVTHILLPEVDVDALQTWTKKLHGLNGRSASLGSVAPDLAVEDGCLERGHDPRHGGPKKGKPQDPGAVYSSLLTILWERIVRPIFKALSLKKVLGGRRPRLWWCPTGPFVFLPIHAAGIYGKMGQSTDCVSDYVISSYTPTLTSLINARKGVVPSEPKVLLVGQPTTPKQRDIPSTRTELESLTVILESYNSESILRINDRTNCNVTVAEVVEQLPKASVLHLACHGSQNKTNPLESGFFLEDEMLTVEKLMSLKHGGALFAFLSACESASGDSKLPDEAVHLAATMMFSGFRSIVGTMWEMGDSDGPRVAKAVYEALFATPRAALDLDCIPIALDSAIRSLREEGADPSRWATYIHMGI